jgi:hypothetical protein
MASKSKARPKKPANVRPVSQDKSATTRPQAGNGIFQKLMGQQGSRHVLGEDGDKMVYPDEVLRLLGIAQPVHPNQASRLFWRYCQDKHLIRGR